MTRNVYRFSSLSVQPVPICWFQGTINPYTSETMTPKFAHAQGLVLAILCVFALSCG